MKNLLKLAIKCLLVCLPMIVVTVYLRWQPFNYVDGEAPYYIWNRDQARQESETYYETIILGDSVANSAFLPEVLSDGTINMALGGMTPVESYYVMEEWLASHPAPKACYIAYQDIHLQQDECFWPRFMYSHRLSPAQGLEILACARRYECSGISSPTAFSDFLSYELYLPNKYMTSLVNAGLKGRRAFNETVYELNELHRGRYIGSYFQDYQEGTEPAVYEHFQTDPMIDFYYRKLIGLCMENGIRVRLIKPPMPDNSVCTDTYREEFRAYYAGLAEEYPEITVDWFDPCGTVYFSDAVHINPRGSLKLSEEIRNRYPEDFSGSDLSERQKEGLNDYIRYEKLPDQLRPWLENRDYILLCWDADGVFPTEEWEAELPCISACYGKPSADQELQYVLTDAEGAIEVRCERMEDPVFWTRPEPETFSMMVLDPDRRIVHWQDYRRDGEQYVVCADRMTE